MTDIDDRIASLEAQLAELKAQVGGGTTAAAPTETTRRDLFKKMAIGAAGVATVGTVLAKTALPAAAANGDPILIAGTTASSASAGTTLVNYAATTSFTCLLYTSPSPRD